MPVTERHGDLFDASEPAFAQGCNCAGAMGKGIAVEFRRRWPEMYEEYRLRCERGEFVPGGLFTWVADDRIIMNLGTQRTWRTNATVQAVSSSVGAMVGYARANGITAVAMPRIAAGLGGLDWRTVRTILDETVPDELTVIVYSPTS